MADFFTQTYQSNPSHQNEARSPQRANDTAKVSCFKIDFVHVLPSPLLAPEGILDEIISIV